MLGSADSFRDAARRHGLRLAVLADFARMSGESGP